MWFDARAKLVEIASEPPATLATIATQAPAAPPVSQLSRVSQPPRPQKQAFLVASTEMPSRAQMRADGLSTDAGQYVAGFDFTGLRHKAQAQLQWAGVQRGLGAQKLNCARLGWCDWG